jgi:hypothetical protein
LAPLAIFGRDIALGGFSDTMSAVIWSRYG